MELLIITRPIRSGNDVFHTGEKITIQNSRPLIDRGYARRLSSDEAQTILNEYVKCAKDLFSKAPEKAPERKTVLANRDSKAVCQERLL